MRRLPSRSKSLPPGLVVVKPKRGEYLVPVMTVCGVLPNLNKLNPWYRRRSGRKAGKVDDRNHHIAYEMVRLERRLIEEHMYGERAARTAARKAVCEAFGVGDDAAKVAIDKYGPEALNNLPAYLSELARLNSSQQPE
jgi:hypothetical protein